MNYGTLKTYKASDIKSSLTKIFVSAEKEPVIITRRGSKPFVLMPLEYLEEETLSGKVYDQTLAEQKLDQEADTSEIINQEQQYPQNTEVDQYWERYLNPDKESQSVSENPRKKSLYYYLFEKHYY